MIKNFKLFENQSRSKLEFEILNTIDAFYELEDYTEGYIKIGFLIDDDPEQKLLCTFYQKREDKLYDLEKLNYYLEKYKTNSIFIRMDIGIEVGNNNFIKSPDILEIMDNVKQGMGRANKSRYEVKFGQDGRGEIVELSFFIYI